MEYWTEVNIKPLETRDSNLLLRIYELIHETLGGTFSSWHFFWEPELRLRIEWKDGRRLLKNKRRLFSILSEWKTAGYIIDWSEGNHGEDGTYLGEAEMYGQEMWPYHKYLWMAGSEFSLACAKFASRGILTKDRYFHWQRFVHLLTNQVNGFWAEEIRLCLAQAWGRAKLFQGYSKEKDQEIEKILKLILEAYHQSPVLKEAERQIFNR